MTDQNERAMCIYCRLTVAQLVENPAVSDVRAWDELAREHNPSCEWIATRAHRYFGETATTDLYQPLGEPNAPSAGKPYDAPFHHTR